MVSFSKTSRQSAHALLRLLGRTLGTAGCALAFACVTQATVATAQTPQVFSGTGTDGVAQAIAAFKAAVGGGDNGSMVGSQPTGFRQVTWDDVPDSLADPYEFIDSTNPYPLSDYYNTTSPRGLILGLGTFYGPFMRVSANASNPTSTPVLFGKESNFAAYSPQRIFYAASLYYPGVKEGSPGVGVTFRVPGSNVGATVSGFGAVFTDVNLPNVSSLYFADVNGQSLGQFFVPPASGHQTVSFLGVVFPTARVKSVAVTCGNNTLGAVEGFWGLGNDVVALDDLVYAEPQSQLPPTITLTTPSTPTVTWTAPFISLAGTTTNAGDVHWQNDHGDSGTADMGVNGEWNAQSIPLTPGINTISLTTTNAANLTATTVLTVNNATYAYYLAEGSTGGFFDTDISIANPNAAPAPVTLTFLREDGARIQQPDTLAPMSRKTYHVNDIPGLEATAFSTIVQSDNNVPLIVERAMFWDRSYYGGKGAVAVQPSQTWYFAEGVENSFFSTFVLLENPGTQATDATLTFTVDTNEPPVVQHVNLPALSRVTIDTGGLPALVGRSFGLVVQAAAPIVAERSTYFESTPTQLWSGGHGSPGVPAPAMNWYFAEGATTSFRDTFLLLNNPGDLPAQLVVQYFTATGNTGEEPVVAPHSRLTIPLNAVNANTPYSLANAEFSIQVHSLSPIVAERAMYWHGAPGPWADGTTTFGANAPALRWGFAEGRAGGPLAFHTYIRVANLTGSTGADVRITYLRADGTTLVQTATVPMSRFVTIDANATPGLQDGESFGTIVESTNGVPIVTERSMYWNSGDVFWAGGLATGGTRLP